MGMKGKISFSAFTLGICGVLIAIIFCALEEVRLSSFVGIVTAVICGIGCYFGFGSWDEEEHLEDGPFPPRWKEKAVKLFTETPSLDQEDES